MWKTKENADCSIGVCASNVAAAAASVQSSTVTAKHITLLPFNNFQCSFSSAWDIIRTDNGSSFNKKRITGFLNQHINKLQVATWTKQSRKCQQRDTKTHKIYKLGQTNNSTPIAIHTSSGYGWRKSQSNFTGRRRIKVADKTISAASRYSEVKRVRCC